MSALVEQRGVPMGVRSPRFSALVAVNDAALRQDVVRGLAALGASDVLEAARRHAAVGQRLAGKNIRKTIYVPDRLVNFVVA